MPAPNSTYMSCGGFGATLTEITKPKNRAKLKIQSIENPHAT